jgi:hypothetical protein
MSARKNPAMAQKEVTRFADAIGDVLGVQDTPSGDVRIVELVPTATNNEFPYEMP